MRKDTTVVGVRLGPDELSVIDALAAEKRCSRSEALRSVLTFGLPLARQGFTLNLTRILFLLEHVGASVDVIMSREHGDVYEHIETIANKRMEQFHA